MSLNNAASSTTRLTEMLSDPGETTIEAPLSPSISGAASCMSVVELESIVEIALLLVVVLVADNPVLDRLSDPEETTGT